MLNVFDSCDPLHAGVFDNQVLDERLVNGNVDVFIDRRGDQKSPVFPIVRPGKSVRPPPSDKRKGLRVIIMVSTSGRLLLQL